MSAEIGAGDAATGRFDTLHAEAKEALSYAANTLRAVTERYREAFHQDLGVWHGDSDALDLADRETPADPAPATSGAATAAAEAAAKSAAEAAAKSAAEAESTDAPNRVDAAEAAAKSAAEAAAKSAAEAEAEEGRSSELRRRIALRTSELGEHHTELARLELAVRGLERTWLFLERGDASLLADPAAPDLADDLQMRIVEAREAERTRLAQEIHDGPAQALANAIFGVEYIEKIVDRDRAAARMELRLLRDRLRRDLGDVRAFISQLRPPILDEVGLDGSLRDAADTLSALTGATVEVDLAAPTDGLSDEQQVVVLRVLQEALQNVRKHAGAQQVTLSTHLAGDRWILEVHDDGRGFDLDAVSIPGRRTFGLQFMRERAELVHGTFEIRSQPASGTVVVLDIPVDERGDSG